MLLASRAPILDHTKCLLLLLSIVLLAVFLGLFLDWENLIRTACFEPLTNWPVGDSVASVISEGGVERCGSVYSTFWRMAGGLGGRVAACANRSSCSLGL